MRSEQQKGRKRMVDRNDCKDENRDETENRYREQERNVLRTLLHPPPLKLDSLR
jgi:hypothetical protein